MTADRKTAEECNHWWLDFNEGKRCSRCGMVVGARFYSKNGGWYTKDASNVSASADGKAAAWRGVPTEPTQEMVDKAMLTFTVDHGMCEADVEDVWATMLAAAPAAPSAPVGVEEIEGVLWICIKEFASNRREMGWLETEAELAARALLARLKDAPAAPAKAPDSRQCTCHPDDNPPVPCPRKYALSECRAAAASPAIGAVTAEEIVRVLEKFARPHQFSMNASDNDTAFIEIFGGEWRAARALLARLKFASARPPE